MLKALYYPYTDIVSQDILKNALLLWDDIGTIIPGGRWTPRRFKKNHAANEAVDLIVRPRIPSTSEREQAHNALLQIVQSGLLSQLLANEQISQPDRNFRIYHEKFLHETWNLLAQHGAAHLDSVSNDYGVPPVLGMIMMSLLADACAGTQIQKVTDQVGAYSWLSQNHAQALGSQHVTGLDASQVAPAYDRLVTLSIEAIDARDIPLDRLIEFRKRELGSGGEDYRAMRIRYLNALQKHIKRIGTEVRSVSDFRELERQFKAEIHQDVSDLKSELNLASIKTLFSKEVAISALIIGGTLVSPIAGLTELGTQFGAIGVIPLIKSAVELRGARRSAFQKHISSWLFLAGKKKVQLR